MAQGLGRSEIAAIVGYEPEYVSWLVRQEVCQGYLAEMNAVVEFRLQAMTGESVDTIHDVMRNGTSDDRLKAAKLQLEATGRIGAGPQARQDSGGSQERLEQLADRLVALLQRGKSRADNSAAIDVVAHEVRT